MELILISDNEDMVPALVAAASATDWRIAGRFLLANLPSTAGKPLPADAVVVVSRSLEPEALAGLREVARKWPVPIVLLTQDRSPEAINAAVKAGVTSYVADCSDPGRLGALLEVARARFGEMQEIRKELLAAKTALADRKHVDKAKGIIMRQKHLDEESAYQAIRKLAMDRNKRVGEVAREIIAAAEVLI